MTRSWLEPLDTEERRSAREFLPVWGLALEVGLVNGVVRGLFRRPVATTVSLIAVALQRLQAVPPLGLTISILTSAAMVMAGFWLMRRFAPDSGGRGIPHIEGFLEVRLPLDGQRVATVKFVWGVLVLGSGMVLGTNPAPAGPASGGPCPTRWPPRPTSS